jgi:mannose-6-phosphate isomerase-like protein (cupin superfamily)
MRDEILASQAHRVILPDGREAITNTFNRETFIFPATGTDIDLVLQEGGSGGGDALLHIHPLADEIFHVRAGRLKIVLGREEVSVGPGESLTVPRGIVHCFVNAAAGETVATVTFDPPQEHVAFFRNFALLTQERPGWFSASGKAPLLLIALALHHFQDHLYLAGPPVWLQKRLFAVLAVVARWRGYQLMITPSSSTARKMAGQNS